MFDFLSRAKALLNQFSLLNAVDIVLLSAVIFISFKFLTERNSAKLIKVFILLLTAALLVNILGLTASVLVFRYFLLTAYLAFIMLYFPELKRNIWSKAKKSNLDSNSDLNCTEEELKTSTEEIVKAVQNMAKNDIGALIVFITNQPPTGILESGVAINGLVSSQLLENIFIPKSPLHDGAVLIKGNKILAAGCFLPLSQELNLPKEFGTRHRAAIGITEMHNVTAVVVSEETGIISVSQNGQLKRYLDGEMLKQNIEGVYGLLNKKESSLLRKKRGKPL